MIIIKHYTKLSLKIPHKRYKTETIEKSQGQRSPHIPTFYSPLPKFDSSFFPPIVFKVELFSRLYKADFHSVHFKSL